MHTKAQPRIDYTKFPDALKALYAVEHYVRMSGLEHSLFHLLKIRASQINRCAYCIDMHTKDARADGETEQRIYALSAWRETPFFTDRERAALDWTEALTLLPGNDVSDELYEHVRQHFSEEELVKLTLGVVAINSWNRVAIPFRAPVGTYQVSKGATQGA